MIVAAAHVTPASMIGMTTLMSPAELERAGPRFAGQGTLLLTDMFGGAPMILLRCSLITSNLEVGLE